MVQTRPYMRARFGLARCLEDMGRVDEAIGHYHELLRLNPNDNQGVRDVLLPVLLATGRDGEAGALLQQFEDDISAAWKYRKNRSAASPSRLLLPLRGHSEVASTYDDGARQPWLRPRWNLLTHTLGVK